LIINPIRWGYGDKKIVSEVEFQLIKLDIRNEMMTDINDFEKTRALNVVSRRKKPKTIANIGKAKRSLIQRGFDQGLSKVIVKSLH